MTFLSMVFINCSTCKGIEILHKIRASHNLDLVPWILENLLKTKGGGGEHLLFKKSLKYKMNVP